ncbi:MAG: hypothetical protein ACLQDY_09690 [Streptosporangiaceae bacterium]|jgi:hypothetical protein
MNASEIGDLLAFAALYDNRKAADPDIMAWLRAIGDLPYADSEAAVAAHYGTTTERLMPGHVRTRVKAMRAERLARTPLPPPPPEVADQPGRYQRIILANVERIADGMSVQRAIGAGKPLEGDPPAEWQQARAALKPPESEAKDPRQIAAEQAAEARRQREEGGAA